MQEFDNHIKETSKARIVALEEALEADVVLFHGPIFPSVEKRFRDLLEDLQEEEPLRDKISIVLNTSGGSVETVEKMVEIVRYHYQDVSFIIPDEAMSAGTIFALSGDSIFMDYTSSLGPIDPQVHNGKDWVPALGYLDQVDAFVAKSAAGTLTDAELIMLQNLDLAMLSRYEQAKNLSITLLKEWLVQYKFKDWATHGTNPDKLGQPVTDDEKQERAVEIAQILSDNNIWHSHGRKIGIHRLKAILKLKIEDYSENAELRGKIRSYSEFISQVIARHDLPLFLHSRRYF